VAAHAEVVSVLRWAFGGIVTALTWMAGSSPAMTASG
jgi:hypothetical protein